MCRKSILSLLLVITITTAFTFTVFAAPQQPNKLADDTKAATPTSAPTEAAPQSDLSGTLTGTGTLMVNGNIVQSGATVLNGSTVATDAYSDAVLDLGALGRLKLRPGTQIRLQLAARRCEIELQRCGSLTQTIPQNVTAVVKTSVTQMMQVASTRGEAKVRGQVVIDDKGTPANTTTAKIEDVTVIQDESRSFDKLEELTATGEATFTVNCCECGEVAKAGGAFVYAPYSWLALLGAAAGVALGIAQGDTTANVTPEVSPTN
ncbi:MAG: hypothetical protein HY231_05245 [Acidobacteria bacterium]|nr:hypothetical protein [Acidobacteriota bacterium]